VVSVQVVRDWGKREKGRVRKVKLEHSPRKGLPLEGHEWDTTAKKSERMVSGFIGIKKLEHEKTMQEQLLFGTIARMWGEKARIKSKEPGKGGRRVKKESPHPIYRLYGSVQ